MEIAAKKEMICDDCKLKKEMLTVILDEEELAAKSYAMIGDSIIFEADTPLPSLRRIALKVQEATTSESNFELFFTFTDDHGYSSTHRMKILKNPRKHTINVRKGQ